NAPASGAPAAQTPMLPAAPAASAPNANPFPPPDPRNFTAASPSKDTVDSFLRASWGYDPNRVWQVQAILKTPVAGVTRVVVLVAEKGGPKEQTAPLAFYVLPDGKHIIADGVLPFGSRPFDENRQTIQSQANGPSKGASAKDLEFVEFADFQCPHCKEAQPIVDKLLADYPMAHFVFQNYPLVQVHPDAFQAAAYGVCVAKLSGNDAFFKFSDAVFAAQDQLTPQSADQTLKAAVTKIGGDPAKVAECASGNAAKDAVDASLNLGDELGVNSTPTIFINGRGLPLNGLPYEALRSVIDFQAKEDGVTLPPRPPAPPPPSLK
ncbi:MAG TPA: thioredoxin domain-containing protein, partial [Acidobacteriaceae bacterium]|nr:thioredoxin domain-containing protein [Acidobacteriaceae bacterium]